MNKICVTLPHLNWITGVGSLATHIHFHELYINYVGILVNYGVLGTFIITILNYNRTYTYWIACCTIVVSIQVIRKQGSIIIII